MAPEAARAKTLRRIQRLKEIEAMGAQRELADAREQETRMQDLQSRAQTMASEYSQCAGAAIGAEILQRAGLARSLAQLGEQAMDQIRSAQQKADQSSAQLSRLDHQQERLSERILELEKAVQARADARSAESVNSAASKQGSGLARGLLKP